MLDCTPATIIQVAAAVGFDGVGLRLSGDQATVDFGAVRRQADESGIRIHDVEVHRITVDATGADELVERAVTVGASALLVVSDLCDRAATVQAVGALRERCASAGLRLGLEYMAWTDPSTPADAIDIAHQTGCEVVVDLLHHMRVGAGVDELEAVVAAGVLSWVQICDAPARCATPDDLLREARHDRLPPGHGELPLRALLARVPDGAVLSVEVQSDELLGMAPLERARLFHDASRRVIG